MTMNMARLRESVSLRFPQVEQLDDSVLCFTRDRGDQPFAVYYLDISAELPQTKESLYQYLDCLIGKRYFNGRKSLQWSNYLYFLRSDEDMAKGETRKAKEFIENDRTYARKFVITEREIDSVLEPHTIAPSEDAQQENVLSTWIGLLTEAGLERAILSDVDLPTRLKHIESDAREGAKTTSTTKKSSVKPAQFLNSLELKRYRPFPLQRIFNFGAVNLVFGSNASGKTSLLEAIELFYCGRNKRNPDLKPSYQIDSVLADGQNESATSQRTSGLFRERNLVWYGQAEVKTNNLFKSFAQFNFLDSDAAVSLSESAEHIEEDLSKLLVGPDASKIWRDIGRVGDEVRSKLREIRPYKKQIEAELTQLDKLLENVASEQLQSDAILELLSQILARHDWKPVGEQTERFLEILHGSLTELITVAQQAIQLEWVASPASYVSLGNYLRDASHRVDKTMPALARFDELKEQRYQVGAAIKQIEHAQQLYDDVVRYINSGLLERTNEYKETKKAIGLYSKLLLSFEPDFIGVLSNVESDKTVGDTLKASTNQRLEVEAAFSATKREYGDFAKLCEESSNLAQQLRQIAGNIIETTEKSDECPLCHTRFTPGELARHMAFGVDKGMESLGQTLLSRRRKLETEFDNVRRLETALNWLQQFCNNSFKDKYAKIGEAIADLKNVLKDLAVASERLKVLDKEISRLADAGLSSAQFDELLLQLNKLGFPLNDYKQAMVDQLLSKIDKEASSKTVLLDKILKEMKTLELTLKEALGISDDVSDYSRAISQQREQIVTTQTILNRLDELYKEFQWPRERPISELIITAEGVRKVAAEARSALVHERHISTQQSEGLKRKEEFGKKLEKLRHRIERLSKAQAVLNKIRNDHSLSQAMESTLQLNRSAIEAIFSSIHSPAEFSGLGSSLATLVRKVDERQAKLTEISTGQRAAFGLSVFLAQNIQLIAGPPVVLIDDPIAHIDDLNSLSFLDYLREIAITGKRQIFFATANDKLAALFERKFDFLGEDQFRRFNLSRYAR